MDIKSILSNIFQFAKNNQFRVKLDDTLDLEPIREALADRQNSDELLKSLLVTQNAMLVRDKVEEADKKIEITNKSFEKAKKELNFTREEIEKLDAKVKELNNFKGEKGDSPSLQELREIIEPLILPPIKGDPGKDYVLTSKDKKEIAKSIKVPIVEKIVETIIEKQPIVTNEIKEVAVTDTSEKIKEKLESLEGDERLDAKAIKNLPKPSFGGGIKRIDGALDTRIISPTDGQALVWNSSRQVWENSSVSGGSGSPGGSDTQVQFNDGGAFGGDDGLTYNKTTNELTAGSLKTDDSGDVTIQSANSADGTGRVLLSSYERAVSPTHYGEVIRADWKAADAKVAIAFRDDFTNPGTPVSKGWLLAHDYLQYTSSSYTKSFTDGDVNTSTDRITITSHGFSSGDKIKFWSTSSLPTGLAHLQQYYAKVIDSNTIEVYREVGLSNIINITSASSGGSHSVANVTLGNNPHKHMSLEVTDSTGALQSRLEFPYDKDSTWIKVIDADFVLTGGKKVQITGENGTNKELTFGLDETSVYTRWSLKQDTTTESGSNTGSDFSIVRFSDAGVALDAPLKITRSTGLATFSNSITALGQTFLLDSSTTATFASDRGGTTNFASFVLRTAGTDEWTVGLRNDSTNNLYIRDNINGVNILQAAQGATPALTLGGAWNFSNASQHASIELGHASDTTLSRVSAGVVAIEGVNILTTATGQPLDSDLTTIAGLTATTDSFLQSKASAWTTRTPTQVTADLIAFVGDAGAGGTKGLVPAPSTGDATKFLKGDGTWGTPAGSGDVSKVGTPADNQIGVWTGDGTIEGDAKLTWSGSLLTVTNATDSASVQVAVFQGDRATNADNDEAYISLKLSDDGGTQKEVARVAWVGTDINAATSVDGRLDFYVMTAGTLASKLQLSGSSLYPTTNDGLALGVGGLGYSDLFLASGGIVDFANSTLQLIHSSDTLRLSALSGSPIMEVRASSSTTSAAQCLITQNSTGDAFARFALSTTISYAIGVDNSVAGDPFKISTAASGTAALGTGDIFTLTSAGALTLASSVTSTSVLATSNDVGALGASGTAWADLFLASGGVINWNAGNATLTHSAGLLTSNVPLSLGTSNALTSGTIELGHASDTTIARVSAGVISVEGVTIPSISSTNTLTNKRITKRTGTTTSSATPTINTDNVDFYSITALATAITSFTTNLSGTPTEAQTLWIAITDNGTARAITWGSSFESSGNVTLPTTTVISTRLDVGFVWNSATSKFRCVAVA